MHERRKMGRWKKGNGLVVVGWIMMTMMKMVKKKLMLVHKGTYLLLSLYVPIRLSVSFWQGLLFSTFKCISFSMNIYNAMWRITFFKGLYSISHVCILTFALWNETKCFYHLFSCDFSFVFKKYLSPPPSEGYHKMVVKIIIVIKGSQDVCATLLLDKPFWNYTCVCVCVHRGSNWIE